ncbi:cytoplasmic dynein 2 heavy chain 1, partial [Aphelenchoides avenae]
MAHADFILSRGHVDVSNDVRFDKPALFRVIFYKKTPKALSSETYKTDIDVLTVNQDASETFLTAIQQIFSKALSQKTDGNKNANHLVELVNELEENLRLNVQRGDSRGAEDGILSLDDELKHWKERQRQGRDPGHYWDALEQLAERSASLNDASSASQLMGFVDIAENALDALWNSDEHYPQPRMKQLIHAIDTKLFDAVRARFAADSLWKPDGVTSELRTAVDACGNWLESVRALTGYGWPRNALHEWKGEPLRMDFFTGFHKRLEQILSLRKLAEEVSDLLREGSVRAEILGHIETALKDFDAITYSPSSEQQWQQKLRSAERSVDPYTLHTLHKYRQFLARSAVKAKLASEREDLVAKLAEFLREQKKEFGEKIGMSRIYTGRYLTEIAAKIMWIRNASMRMDQLRELGAEIFDDMNSYKSVDTSAKDFREELKHAESEQFDAWCREIIQYIDDPSNSIALQTTGRLMMIEKDHGRLLVNYSDRLAKLLTEVRQLSSLGLPIPSKIQQCVKVGDEFYRHGQVLKQVAMFYNTIETQMLPCQQAMMLDEALAFEKLVIPSGKSTDDTAMTVTWDKPKELEEYIQKLKDASYKLTTHNRRLRKVHEEVMEKIVRLVSTENLDEEKWNAALLEVRQKFADEERKIANRSNARPWAIHLDRQLYKALQVQFQWSLESLQSQLPTIHTQLVFREQSLQLRPGLEEVRVRYYKELRKLLSIPLRFRGIQQVNKGNEFFSAMLGKNASRFHGIYTESEKLFEKVSSVGDQFEDWIVLAQVNIEDLIEEHFKKASDWEAELKTVKAKGREVERLPNEIRLECIVVSTNSVKSAIEDVLQRLYDALVWTLRHSINSELQEIGRTLTQAIETLSTNPQTMEELALANQHRIALVKENKKACLRRIPLVSRVKEQMTLIDEKNVLLRSVAGGGVDNLASVKGQYEKFQAMLESHEEVMKEQVEVMKSNVGDRVKAVNDEVERLFARWNQFKPKSDVLNEDRAALVKAVEFIREKRQQFDELSEQHKKIL